MIPCRATEITWQRRVGCHHETCLLVRFHLNGQGSSFVFFCRATLAFFYMSLSLSGFAESSASASSSSASASVPAGAKGESGGGLGFRVWVVGFLNDVVVSFTNFCTYTSIHFVTIADSSSYPPSG